MINHPSYLSNWIHVHHWNHPLHCILYNVTQSHLLPKSILFHSWLFLFISSNMIESFSLHFSLQNICVIGGNRNWNPRMEWTVFEVCIISKGMGVKLPLGHPFLSSQNYLHRRRYFLIRLDFVFFPHWNILLEYGLNNFLIRFVGSNVQDCVEVLPRRGPRCC